MSRMVRIRLGFAGDDSVHEVEVADDEPSPWDLDTKHTVVSTRVPRQEAPDKVTGRAKYTADLNLPEMLHGALLVSPHAAARVRGIDLAAALRSPGVHAALAFDERTIRFAGQPVAAVAAETIEQAADALGAIRVEYEPGPFVVKLEDASKEDAPSVTQGSNVRGDRDQEEGDASRLLAGSDAVIEATYETQVQTHSSLEPHGIVARWDAADRLTVWCSTQSTFLVRDNLSRAFRIPAENIKVICHHVGGGFGAKFGVRPFEVVACRLAREASRPVKLMADRATEHRANGNRPSSIQRVKIGAMKDGTLTAIDVETTGVVGVNGNARCANPIIYQFRGTRKKESSVQIHAGPSCAHRAPGHPQGVFALEQAVDELAVSLGMDPLEFRAKNDPDPVRRAQYEIGAKEIGWHRRQRETPKELPRVVRGIGMASTRWGGMGQGAEALVVIQKSGAVEVYNGAQDIGTGTRTAMAVVAAEELGLAVSMVRAHIGETDWPDGPPSGGSNTGPSIFPAVRDAAFRAKRELLGEVAREISAAEADLSLEGGKVVVRGRDRALEWAEACRLMSGERISVIGRKRTVGAGYKHGVAGCQFAEVEVDTGLGLVRAVKIVAVQDCGRVVNRLTVESQITGGVIQGLSYAFFEERLMDRATGQMLNPDLLFYKIAGAADMPEIVPVTFDVANGFNSTSVVGLGEPPVVPTAAAIANAFANATGKRVRKIPMTPATVLAALEG